MDDRATRVGDQFDRQPPQDITAEQSVLGGMLLSKDAIADVVEVLRPGDFYRPAHQAVYDCVLDLYGRGEPADPVTISADLERRGELARVGGAPYLHTLIATVPTAANAGYYAEIVAEKAVLRRLVEAGTHIVQLGYHGAEGADVDTVVDRAQTAIYDVTERRMSEDYIALEDLLQPTMDEIDAIASHGGASSGVPTGFADLDAVTNGLHPGQMIVVAARPGLGKALALNTPLPTPHGWTTMGEVAVGDRLLDATGRPTAVVAATPVMRGRPCFVVEFSDGAVIVADAGHQWVTATRATASRGGARVRTTAELAATTHLRHSVAPTAPLDLPERELPVAPYSFGVRLVAGTVPPEVAMYVDAEEQEYPRHRVAADGLRTLLVLGRRRIPAEYQRASAAQRRALLAGLLDADGTVTGTGEVQFCVTDARLARDVRELVNGLGYRCVTATRRLGDRAAERVSFVVSFATEDDVFRLERKRLLHKERRAPASSHWEVVDVRPVPSVAVRCVRVAAADHLFLAGRSMIPTHNSTLGLDWVRSCSVAHGMTSLIFSLEMSRTEIVMRLLSAEARIRLSDMRSGRMSDDDWTRLARRMGEISEAPLFIDDSPNMTMMEIRAKARRLKQRNDLKLIVLDYLQLMTSGKRVESRQQEVSEFSRQLKLLAKELEVPLVAISQLNRGPEQRTDKKPMLADLRESGCLTAGTRVLRADTGAEVTLGDLLSSGEQNVPVWSLDERLRLVARPMTHAFSSGTKEAFRLRLTSGRTVEATTNHPFLTLDGWCRLDELRPGSRLAVPRRLPEPTNVRPWPEQHVVLLAQSLRLRATFRLTHGRRNPIAAWLDALGLFGLRSHEKFVPDAVFGLSGEQITLFLRHLWATDGCVHRRGDAAVHIYAGDISFCTTSRRLADDVSHLLLRAGVMSRISVAHKAGYRDGYHVTVSGLDDQRVFLSEIGCHGARGLVAADALAAISGRVGNTNVDTVPRAVWERVRAILTQEEMTQRGMTHREFSTALGTMFCGATASMLEPASSSSAWKRSVGRARMARVAEVLDDAELELLATNDVLWDEVKSIESIGEQPVYDATVLGTHNFIANGIAVHNSIEQDADIVLLLHRPDAFERDDPRAGEADLILAKHRNGPTSTITVAHQLHYSRFVDMAQG